MQAGEKVKALVCLSFHYKQATGAAAGQQSVADIEPAWRRSNRSVLLLQRRSKHNDKKWGLPGGTAEDADASLRVRRMQASAVTAAPKSCCSARPCQAACSTVPASDAQQCRWTASPHLVTWAAAPLRLLHLVRLHLMDVR